MNMKDKLSGEKLLASIAVSGPADALLTALEIQTSTVTAPGREEGDVKLDFDGKPLGVFDLKLGLPGSDRPYVLIFDGPAGARTGFRLAVSLNQGPQKPLFTLAQGLPGYVLKPATPKSSADAEASVHPLLLRQLPGAPAHAELAVGALLVRRSAHAWIEDVVIERSAVVGLGVSDIVPARPSRGRCHSAGQRRLVAPDGLGVRSTTTRTSSRAS